MKSLHDLDLRMRCTLQTLHHILVLILQYSSTNHKDAVTVKNPDTALAKIIKCNYAKFKGKKALLKDHYKNYFYDDPSKKEKGLRRSIRIKSLDLNVISMILRTAYLTSIGDNAHKCCANCEHECIRCNVKHLTFFETECGDCEYGPCAKNCNADCGYIKFILFAIICRAFRNTNAHLTPELCDKFQNGTEIFKDFPDSNDWTKIWNVVNKAALDCLKYLQNKGHIKENAFEDLKMNLRIAYKQEANFLIPIVGSYIDDFRRLIISEAELTEQLTQIKTCFREGRCLIFNSSF